MPPPPQYVMLPQLQRTGHCMINHYVKIWKLRLGDANNMHPLSWGGTKGKDLGFLNITCYFQILTREVYRFWDRGRFKINCLTSKQTLQNFFVDKRQYMSQKFGCSHSFVVTKFAALILVLLVLTDVIFTLSTIRLIDFLSDHLNFWTY